jgi:CubicO group peptidase (beta-lactamase class C family)
MRLKSLALGLAGLAAALTIPGERQWARDGAPQAWEQLFDTDQGATRGVLMIVDGKVTAKRYAPGYSDANRFISWSMAKTVTAVLVGELVADGKLALDAPVPFDEWRKPGDPRGAITLRQMLHMSSGLRHDELGAPAYTSDTNRTLFLDGTGAMAARGLARDLEARPGARYEYDTVASLLLSELIVRQLTPNRDPKTRAQAYRAFAEDRLLRPAGIASAVMDFDGAGTQIGGSIIYMTLDDWGRFGSVLLEGKALDGSALIAPDWLAFLKTPSATDPGYGGHVWLNRPRSKENAASPALFPGKGPDTAFGAVGHLGQYVIVSPEQRLVLVRLGKTNDPDLGPVRAALGRVVAGVAR